MRISDWSSDVCSSDLLAQRHHVARLADDDGEDASPALGPGEAAVRPGLLAPLHLEGAVRDPDDAGHLDGDTALTDHHEGVVAAGQPVEHQPPAGCCVVIWRQTTYPHHHRRAGNGGPLPHTELQAERPLS